MWMVVIGLHHIRFTIAVQCVLFGVKKKKKNHIRIIKQPTQKFQKTQILTNKHVQNISLIPTQNFQTNLQSF